MTPIKKQKRQGKIRLLKDGINQNLATSSLKLLFLTGLAESPEHCI